MKKTVLTSIFCTFAFFLTDNAVAQNRCAGLNERPVVRLRGTYGKLKYITDYDSKQLDELSKRTELRESNMFAAGLADIKVYWTLKMQAKTRRFKDYECVIPVSVDILFGYRDPIIYISKDLKPESCQYNIVLRHEQQHQQINLEVLDFYLPMLKQEFKKIAQEIPPQEMELHGDSDEALTKINKSYSEAIKPLVNRFQITLQIEQKRLDNYKNYKYETNLCRKH